MKRHNNKVKRQTGKEDTDPMLPAYGLNEMNFRQARNRSVRFNDGLSGINHYSGLFFNPFFAEKYQCLMPDNNKFSGGRLARPLQ